MFTGDIFSHTWLVLISSSRWRRLEGKDPETLELIQKINNLQKRLISKQEDLIDKVFCLFYV